ncbi:MAG: hypothetical protein ABIN25_09515, partial [Ginsengibacter sp.]
SNQGAHILHDGYMKFDFPSFAPNSLSINIRQLCKGASVQEQHSSHTHCHVSRFILLLVENTVLL